MCKTKLRYSDYKSAALPTELYQHLGFTTSDSQYNKPGGICQQKLFPPPSLFLGLFIIVQIGAERGEHAGEDVEIPVAQQGAPVAADGADDDAGQDPDDEFGDKEQDRFFQLDRVHNAPPPKDSAIIPAPAKKSKRRGILFRAAAQPFTDIAGKGGGAACGRRGSRRRF